MQLQVQSDQNETKAVIKDLKKFNDQVFTKDYVDFLNEAGWRLEKKLPSNSSNYSDLLEDTDWKSNELHLKTSIHYRRDLDALS
tara:strand:+ start:575 stop:826 length:252 start_codon:yes stop_codon:yes gene_type:complete